ncbi:MAG: hypothetical protein GQ574_21475 [Crocinitomix sp.]|nr:hypothetical protein [Crocinitomix sp.]
MKQLFLSLLLFSAIGTCKAQSYYFTCGDFDYAAYSGGGTFENVAESGVDISISGLAADWCNGISFVTGINNGVNDGVVHTYTYTFSEAVDVSFSISNINVDAELPCYSDLLVFSGDPIFNDPSNVTVDGDSIIPMIGLGMPAYVGISYENITSFTITHGDGGAICNPGYVMISNMNFNKVEQHLDVAQLDKSESYILNSFVQEKLILKGDFEELPELSVVDIMGRKMNVSYTEGDGIIVDVAILPNGQYFLYYEENEGIKVARFIVSH